MEKPYWQAKIWGILHDPVLKALHTNYGRGGQGFWENLAVMAGWPNPEASGSTLAKHILAADYLTSASDRAAIGSLSASLNYDQNGLVISHLLSGAQQTWKLPAAAHREAMARGDKHRTQVFWEVEAGLFPEFLRQETDPRRVFWWLWRCLPEAVGQRFGDPSLLLMPAETRIPDGSIWSHLSLTAALAGALAGYDLTPAEVQRWPHGEAELSRPYLATFSFSPVQELIKASRKMRDFWAGSWLLHYLSARVCWALAWKYGPDALVYPSLWGQPLVDTWLVQGVGSFPGWRDFAPWVPTPSDRALLTAGFPNVMVMVLPQAKVKAAMQMARQTLLEEWERLGNLAFAAIRAQDKHWMPGLEPDNDTWNLWLKCQWQTYWAGYPLGAPHQSLRSTDLHKESETEKDQWTQAQNEVCGLSESRALFLQEERKFLRAAGKLRQQKQGRYPFSANVGSWWAYAFDRLRLNLAAVKKARAWELPTAFGVRSTVSGIGSALHAQRWQQGQAEDLEESIRAQWQRRAGLFDGREMLNATETLKRALPKILPKLFPNSGSLACTYPDLTAGVAGYLKTHDQEAIAHFREACQGVLRAFPEAEGVLTEMQGKWGIPWADGQSTLQKTHPRLLNVGWLLEDLGDLQLRPELTAAIAQYYRQNNPTDWYVLAAGDGDGMSQWLQGKPLQKYRDYVPADFVTKVQNQAQQTPSTLQALEQEVAACFTEFLDQQKRMGPSSHGALSRALLDFSNQLVPYLTEQRYAGRLIYGGGDDVLAYTNLWEWDRWLWDIRQCFRGQADPGEEFAHTGDYWQWGQGEPPPGLSRRPLFTMGRTATISFGIVIAHQSVPLAIALENLWAAEDSAKEHQSPSHQKDAVQVRVMYGNGNILTATAKFETFRVWQHLLNLPAVEPALFEQAASLWEEHPAPKAEAIALWSQAFCDRREKLTENADEFGEALTAFLQSLWAQTQDRERDRAISQWLRLAAFVVRKRQISLSTSEPQ